MKFTIIILNFIGMSFLKSILMSKKYNLSIILFLTLLVAVVSYTDALAFFNPSLSPKTINSRFVKPMILAAEEYANQRDFNTALELLSAAESYEPDNVSVHLDKALIYEATGKTAQAEKELLTVLKINSENKQAAYYLAVHYDKLGNEKKALEYLHKSAELMPYNPYIFYELGVIFIRNNDFNNSMIYNAKAVELKPDFAAALNNLCYSQANVGSNIEALSNCEKAYALEPASPAVIDSVGFAYYGLNQYEKAVEYFEKALTYDKNIAEIYLHLADTYLKLDNEEKAVQNYEKYLKLETKSPESKRIKKLVKKLKKSINKTQWRKKYYERIKKP